MKPLRAGAAALVLAFLASRNASAEGTPALSVRADYVSDDAGEAVAVEGSLGAPDGTPVFLALLSPEDPERLLAQARVEVSGGRFSARLPVGTWFRDGRWVVESFWWPDGNPASERVRARAEFSYGDPGRAEARSLEVREGLAEHIEVLRVAYIGIRQRSAMLASGGAADRILPPGDVTDVTAYLLGSPPAPPPVDPSGGPDPFPRAASCARHVPEALAQYADERAREHLGLPAEISVPDPLGSPTRIRYPYDRALKIAALERMISRDLEEARIEVGTLARADVVTLEEEVRRIRQARDALEAPFFQDAGPVEPDQLARLDGGEGASLRRILEGATKYDGSDFAVRYRRPGLAAELRDVAQAVLWLWGRRLAMAGEAADGGPLPARDAGPFTEMAPEDAAAEVERRILLLDDFLRSVERVELQRVVDLLQQLRQDRIALVALAEGDRDVSGAWSGGHSAWKRGFDRRRVAALDLAERTVEWAAPGAAHAAEAYALELSALYYGYHQERTGDNVGQLAAGEHAFRLSRWETIEASLTGFLAAATGRLQALRTEGAASQ